MSVYDQSIHLSSLLRTLQSKALFCRQSALAEKVSGLGPKVLLFRILLRTGFLFVPVEVFPCPGSTFFPVVRVDISSFEMLFAQTFSLFSPNVFSQNYLSVFWVFICLHWASSRAVIFAFVG